METNQAINSKDKHNELINQVFAHHDKKDEIFPLSIKEIVEAQKRDKNLKIYFKPKTIIIKKRYGFHLIDGSKVLCKDGKLITPTLSSTGQLACITIIYNILDTLVLKTI